MPPATIIKGVGYVELRMESSFKLNELRELLERFSYPISRNEVRDEVGGVTLVYADGDEAFETVVDRLASEEFASVDELEAEIFNTLPTEAVGEPGQAEGEG